MAPTLIDSTHPALRSPDEHTGPSKMQARPNERGLTWPRNEGPSVEVQLVKFRAPGCLCHRWYILVKQRPKQQHRWILPQTRSRSGCGSVGAGIGLSKKRGGYKLGTTDYDRAMGDLDIPIVVLTPRKQSQEFAIHRSQRNGPVTQGSGMVNR
ncbi:hypothetical protein TESG_08329 [Trichophyton tonsurans CBS 112818]|uniref:Uncharacterized protein n=1 Tax=Trichophyton tonsurans (strain CBS 112818) TaxID=647933 RepID=F2RT66_TRIT1|nr:hypothetical protein TESG_08329 [Trichophyton tonsurans CBS 112818]